MVDKSKDEPTYADFFKERIVPKENDVNLVHIPSPIPIELDEYQQKMFDEYIREKHPNAVVVAQYSDKSAMAIDDFSYSIDLEIDDTVLEIFNDEWQKATVERDFFNRPRRALSKVVEYWQDPEPNAEVDIVSYASARKVIGKGKLVITDRGLEMVGTFDDVSLVKQADLIGLAGVSLYQKPEDNFHHVQIGDHVTHKLLNGTIVTKVYRGRVWDTDTQTFVLRFDDIEKSADGQ